MFVNVRVVLLMIILDILYNSNALVELPHVEDNDILNTESAIRSTTNKLFSNIKLKGVKQNPKLKQYGLIHNYFVSLTLKDYKNLKEIARLTRVDKKAINNSSENFIDLINEILNEDSSGFISKTKAKGDTFENEVGHYINDYSRNVAFLKENYGDNSPRVDINRDIIKILQSEKHYLNKTAHRYNAQENNIDSEYEDLLDDNDFWVPDSDFRRIFRSQRSKIKYFPFMASIQFFNNFQCGGSVIKDDLVITAASCLQLAWNNRLFRENPSFLAVRIGSNYYEGGGEMISVLEIYFHPSYNPTNLKNNLAILRLTRKIRFKERRVSRVKKINFDRQASALPMNTNGITIIGWGARTRSNVIKKPWENKISYSILDVYTLQDCQDTYSKEYVTETNFCAGKVSIGSGACNKDVGDPGLVHGVLTGVVSFGSPVCGTADAPTVFTKLGYFADWIEEIFDQESIIPQKKKLSTLLPHGKFTPSKVIKIYENKTQQNTILEPTWITPITPPHPVIPIYDLSVQVSSPLYPGFKIAGGRTTNLFKQYLKTMFKSKEIDEYIDLNDGKESLLNNADVIAERQQQLAQDAPDLYDTSPSTSQIPKLQYYNDLEITTSVGNINENYDGYTTSKHDSTEHAYEAEEGKESVLLDIYKKMDNDINLAEDTESNEDNYSKDVIVNNHIPLAKDFNMELVSDIKKQNNYDKLNYKMNLGNALDLKLDKVDQVLNKKTIVSSKESDEVKQKDSEEIEARKELENNILKLIHTIDLKENLEQVAKKLGRKKNKKMIKNKDIDDSEKRDAAAKSNDERSNINSAVQAEDNDDIRELKSEERNNSDSGNDLDATQESHQENDQQNGNVMLNENENIKNNTSTKTNNTKGLGNFFSKKVLFEILTDMIDYQNKNNTIKL